MKVLPIQFKEAIKKVKAAGTTDKQLVIVRAEETRLVLVGIGTEHTPGTEAECPLKGTSETVAIITPLAGLRWVSKVLAASDEVELHLCEKTGLKVVITSWKTHGRDATLGLRSESTLMPYKAA
jgi:hypothetical protein